jgi:uncharacterized protein (TIGR00730 family)
VNIAVYCGSSFGMNPAYQKAARTLGQLLATRGLGLVYGGGNVGLMGATADAALEAGGTVIGVIPHALEQREVAHRGLSTLHVVPDMHARKAKMIELADAFIVLPGGIGTLEELFEVWTWAQLGYHQKPVGLLNIAGYFDSLLEFLDFGVTQGFQKQTARDLLVVNNQPLELLNQMRL